MNTIIFDLDGTLLNTLDDLADSVNYMLTEFGFPQKTKSEVRKNIGGGADILVRNCIPQNVDEETFLSCKKEFLAYYIKHANDKTDLYPEIRELVRKLCLNGYKMGVVSSKGDGPVKELIKNFFGTDMLVALGERAGVRKKPAADSVFVAMKELKSERKDCVYVGDSEVDIETAKNAGMPSIIVTWGFRDKQDLLDNNPDYLVETVEELYDTIIKLSESKA